jgi:hypothetical protein
MFSADFLSPKIARLHTTDPLMDSYIVNTCDTKNLFGQFLAIGRGERLHFDREDLRFFALLSRELGNNEVLSAILAHFHEEITEANFLEHWQLYDLREESLNEIIHYGASHFHQFSKLLNGLTVDQLHHILGHRELTIWSEDWLCDWICDRAQADPSFWSLLQFVHFEFLSVASMTRLSSSSSEFLDSVSDAMWKRLWSRLILPVCPPTENDHRKMRKIHVLQVRASDSSNCVNLDFLNELKGDTTILFQVQTIERTAFISEVNRETDYLKPFDILVLVGQDHHGLGEVGNQLVKGHIEPYWKKGGSILFLHDVIWIQDHFVEWAPFSEVLGISARPELVNWGTTAHFSKDCDPRLMKVPFALPESIPVANTHCSQKVNPQFIKIRLADSAEGYFCCNGRVGFSQLGHSTEITLEEKKVTANIIFHLVTSH